MSIIKRDKDIDAMFDLISSSEEKQTVDKLYASKLKGSAVKFQTRRIKKALFKLLGRDCENTEKPDARFIKISHNGKTHYEIAGVDSRG